MKVSRTWLQTYFETELPSTEELAEALTFHAFEIEEIEGDQMEVKVLPDRAAYALSHRGIAFELSAILDLPLKSDPLRESLPEWPTTAALTVSVEDPKECLRYMGALVSGVKIGPSPAWLTEALESIGQRSINNVVDATNYVMLNLGQPLHAFDAAKLVEKDGVYSIAVRGARNEEKITTLTGDEYTLPAGTLLITDGNTEQGIGIAGVKGGKHAEVTTDTTDLIIEAANFEGTSVRKTSQALRLWTDASLRFQNRPSPELVAYGMRDVLALVQEISGGEIEGVIDVCAALTPITPVQTSREKINGLLGSSYSVPDITDIFDRLGFTYTTEGDFFTVTAPFERRDIILSEDIAEEVGRIKGYDGISPELLPALPTAPDQSRFRGIERVKDFFTERGFIELSTQTFAATGDIVLANPLDQTRPALRTTLRDNMREALKRASTVAPRVLGPVKEVRLFEIGTVFESMGEGSALVFGIHFLEKKKASVLTEVMDAFRDEFGIEAAAWVVDDTVVEVRLTGEWLMSIGTAYDPQKTILGVYHPFSLYPFALRDVAVWTPAGTEEDQVKTIIVREAGQLLARIDLFDRFTKESEGVERTSYAFRLVFESFERTLSDEDLNPLMENITAALNANDGWEVR